MTERYEDEALLADLAEALRETRPLTEGVAARAKGAFTWRTIDEDLLTAELSFDSAHTAGATRRSEASRGGRVLVFTTELRCVEVEVLSDRVVGQFLPPSTGEVQVEGEHGLLATVDVDELGFFLIEPVPEGLVRLRCTTPTTRLVTAWVRL
jgi:hypothetical protein